MKEMKLVKAWKNNLRGWDILWKLNPYLFIAYTVDALLGALLPYTTVWISAQIIGELAGGRNTQILFKWVMAEIIVSLILGILKYATTRWNQYESKITYNTALLSEPFINKFYTMDFADIDKQYVHDLYARIEQNANFSEWGLQLCVMIYETFSKSIFEIVGGAVLSVNLFLLKVPGDSPAVILNNPIFIFIMFAGMIMMALAGGKCELKSRQYWIDYTEKATYGNRYYTFYGFQMRDRKRAVDVRMYDQHRNVSGIYMRKENVFGAKSQIAKASVGPKGIWAGLSEATSMIPTGAVYLYVCLKAWGGAFGVGQVTQYIGAFTYLFTGIKDCMSSMNMMAGNSEFLETVYELLDLPNNMYQGSLTTEKRIDNKYEVEFRNVSFKYPGSEEYALRNVNLKFRVGEKLAVVGMNGSGKTTFIKLLCRLYDPTEGEILLNGINIRKYRYDEYINIFSVVFQDFKLLAFPLGQNVAGSINYDEAKVLKCLKEAGFDNLDEKMKKGLETYLYKDNDKEGVEISGGEAQKIAIARALYKDAPFIILDEPTAALDPVAEAEIYERFNEMVDDRTAVYISHRLSSCKFCDEIAVFHEGKVVQKGTHTELLQDAKGKYYELWNAQAQYYNDEKAVS